MRLGRPSVLVGAILVSLLMGCPPENFPNSLDTTRPEVDEIINDTDLTPQEKREALTALGFTPTLINALLSNETLGNQFGGNLESAYEKVTDDRLTDLTPDEVQYYVNAVTTADEELSYSVDDAAADAIATLFETHGLNSAADVSLFIIDPTSDITATIPDGILQDVFVDFDPADVNDQLP